MLTAALKRKPVKIFIFGWVCFVAWQSSKMCQGGLVFSDFRAIAIMYP